MLTQDEVLAEFEAAGALLKGHFVLSSGLHSDTYLNKSIVSMYPERTERLCRALAEKALTFFGNRIDYVVAPAMGAIIYGYETARHLGKPFMFTERVDGAFTLRRGFSVSPGARVLIVEDIISTGLSARECIAAVSGYGAEIVGLVCLIDRSGGTAKLGTAYQSLASLKVDAWPADDLPPHLAKLPAVKPGSRNVSQ